MTAATDPASERLSVGVTVVTATERLARELRRRHDQQQLARGNTAWESADVLSYDAFLLRIWRDLNGNLNGDADTAPRPILLNQWQLVAAWEAIIRDDIRAHERDDEPLWNTHASAKNASDAWRLVHTWRLDLARCAKSAHRDHRCWLRWADTFQRQCVERNWTDPCRLADVLCELLGETGATATAHLPARIAFDGFEHIPPQQQALIDALTSAGAQVDIVTPAEPINRQTDARAYQDERAQWLSAACWAREQLLANPQATLAIIAPNLGKAAPALEEALRQILAPQQLLEPDAAAAPYHISLGQKLIRYPVVNAALVALRPLSGAPLPLEAVSQLILSPFIRGADSEALARCKLEAHCRRRLPYQISFKRLLAELSRAEPHCPLLLDALNAAHASRKHHQRAQPASDWAQCFAEWLEQIGWPGERALDSDEYQAAGALGRELQNLATLDWVTPPLRVAAAWSWLQRRTAEQPFQVESRGAPVQVLGVFEAAGQRFDALWFGDLVETDWPPAQRPNPFIDIRVQREAGIFAANDDANRARAERLQQQLIASATEVVLSRPKYADDDIEAEASPLFDRHAEREMDAHDAHDATPAAIIHRSQPTMERIEDTRAPAFAGGAVGGGVAVIENQAKCPFRAFAIHRLGARDIESNEQGLAAGERGSLIHHALQLLWESIQSSANLHALSDAQRRELIADVAEQAGKRYRVSSGCGERFHQAQTAWVVDVLSEWLAVEATRADGFVVRAREAAATLRLGALELNLNIDRIDELEDQSGKVALIDYKTGASTPVVHWGGARPRAPQLPLYALARGEAVESIAYARVKKGDCGFSGVTRAAGLGAAVEKTRGLKHEFADWDALVAHWQRALPQLADEFAGGEARVNPLDASVCASCQLHGFCRVADAQ